MPPAAPAMPTLALLAAGLFAAVASASAADDVLTPSQRAWLQRQGAVQVAPERDYGPFVFETEQGPAGLSVDLLRLVQQHTGLQVTWLPAAPLGRQLQMAQQGQVDVLTSLRRTPERAAYLAFTSPYVRVPAILVARAGDALPLAARRGQPVAVGAGYAVERPMREAYPEVRWQAVPDDEAALRGVADGRYAAAVVDAASAAFVVRRAALHGLAAAGEAGFVYELGFAVRRDRPELLAVLEAGLRAIGAAKRQAVLDRWLVPLEDAALAHPPSWTTRAGWALLGLALLATLWVRLRRRRATP